MLAYQREQLGLKVAAVIAAFGAELPAPLNIFAKPLAVCVGACCQGDLVATDATSTKSWPSCHFTFYLTFLLSGKYH